jgi:hypothetical protein
VGARLGETSHRKEHHVTLVWFVVWLVWNLVGDNEPLRFDPVNFWTGALLFSLALDLGANHATGRDKHHHHPH